MTKESQAKIFLADERGLNQTDWFQSQNTFNFGKYFSEHKRPFGNLYVLNDDMLAGGRAMSLIAEEPTCAIVLPIAGAANCKKNDNEYELVAAGQIYITNLKEGDKIEVRNPFQSDPINFLQIWIRAELINDAAKKSLHTYADVNANINELVAACSYDNLFSLYLGKFSGRGETVFNPSKKSAGCFLFVIEGAFEVNGRLLHARDGLGLWDANEVEMEALSNDAIILLIETMG